MRSPAFKIFVQNATKQFGFVTRDVYGGVFALPMAMEAHNASVRTLRCEDLKAIVRACEQDNSLCTESSHHIFEVYPRPSPIGDILNDDSWTINFKSVSISRKVAVSIRMEEDRYLPQTYNPYHETPMSSSSAAMLFEANAHHILFKVGVRTEPHRSPPEWPSLPKIAL